MDRLKRELNIELVWDPMPDRVSGFLWHYQPATGGLSIPHVVINSRHPETRQLFTLAHEEYHCLIGDTVCLSLDDPFVAKRPEEVAANRFAAELLMPAWQVRQIAAAHGGPAEIAREFGVSLEAANHRLSEILEMNYRSASW